jgi:hypothetical protein
MATEKRLVDANVLIEKEKPMDSITHGMVMAVQSEHILDAPTVDAVEVVRCCDCQNCTTFQQAADSEVLLFCEKWKGHQMVDPTDFCSYGERRINNADD